MTQKSALYNIGDLITEHVDGLDLTTGIITEVRYDPLDKDFVYSILWSDMGLETEIFESIIKWRIQNEIFGYYEVAK